MKENLLFLLILISIFFVSIENGFAVQMQKTIIDKGQGFRIVTIEQQEMPKPINSSIIENRDEIQLLWQGVESSSTGGQIKVSSTTQNTFIGWNLNDDRCSLYYDCFYPLWESTFGPSANFCIDMLEDGSIMAAGKDNSAKIFQVFSNTPVWEHTFSGNILGIALSPDGTTVFVSEELTSSNKVYSFDIETSEMNWENTYSDDYYNNGLVLSGDGEHLVFYQYCNIYILNPSDGSLIDQVSNYGEGIPSISDDGSILITGDYTGEAQVYEYNTGSQSYNQLWDFQEDGGNYDPWITSMSVSGDGTTIAIGTLIYVSLNDDIFDGRVHLFNTYSSEPVWVFDNMEHLASSIDMSYDGSTIAVGGWGPVDNSVEDFFLFDRESNEPIFSLNTPGSIRFVDISSDGTICSFSGKAIHETTFGNGGTIYCVSIDSEPPAPENVTLESNENEVTISWDMPDISDFNYFNIYSSVNYNEFFLLDIASIATYTYTLPEQGNYQFYVTTVDNADQESEPSETVEYEYTSIDPDNNILPSAVKLYQNYPNPFNPETTISFSLNTENTEDTELVIYNLKGQKVKTFPNLQINKSPNQQIIWNGKDDYNNPVSSGIYLYKLKSARFISTKKMILMK
ncbi:MAG: T9SS type A sorting domain-containing protein [Candidatus Cloacimonetes bacterium]|nr:T9SS type A sorting domain-containing protein [Candidatus Cloacimonadota bacterium]